MHGSVLLDPDGEVVRPAILWNDQRTGLECDEIRRRVGKQKLIEIAGNDALTGFTAPKLLWVQEHDPKNWARVRHVLLPKDYVRLRPPTTTPLMWPMAREPSSSTSRPVCGYTFTKTYNVKPRT
jgi:ribulose kinase